MSKIKISDLISNSKTRKISALTCYTSTNARILDGIVDILLVGDSVGMVVYGMKNTQSVSLEMMINHGLAVSSSVKKSFVIVDVPFGTYEISKEQAFETCSKLLAHTNADALKMEGGCELAETISFLVDRGIPVVGHIGLMPQKYKLSGTFKKISDKQKVLLDLKSVSDAGAFCTIVENITTEISDEIAKNFQDLLTIGIGAGKNMKGEIAVFEDIAGLSGEYAPAFSTPLASLSNDFASVAKQFVKNLQNYD